MRKYGVLSPLFYLCTVTILCIITSSELFPRNDYKSFKSIFTHAEKQLFMEWMNKDREILNVPPVEYMKDVERLARLENSSCNRVWRMDFVQDSLFDGSRFRILSIVDNYSKKCHALAVGKSLKGADVVDELERLKVFEGVIPERIQCDNGSEFISKEVDRWAYEHSFALDFSRPGKPTDNPYVESFNEKLKDACLSLHWFLLMEDATQNITSWKDDYNHFRSHSTLGDISPEEFINQTVLSAGCSNFGKS